MIERIANGWVPYHTSRIYGCMEHALNYSRFDSLQITVPTTGHIEATQDDSWRTGSKLSRRAFIGGAVASTALVATPYTIATPGFHLQPHSQVSGVAVALGHGIRWFFDGLFKLCRDIVVSVAADLVKAIIEEMVKEGERIIKVGIKLSSKAIEDWVNRYFIKPEKNPYVDAKGEVIKASLLHYEADDPAHFRKDIEVEKRYYEELKRTFGLNGCELPYARNMWESRGLSLSHPDPKSEKPLKGFHQAWRRNINNSDLIGLRYANHTHKRDFKPEQVVRVSKWTIQNPEKKNKPESYTGFQIEEGQNHVL